MNDKSHAATSANATPHQPKHKHVANVPSLVVFGNWGRLICHSITGNVLSYEHLDSAAYGTDWGYHDIVRIDIPTFRKQWGYPDMSEVDILHVGYWLKDGRYVPPAVIAAQAVPSHAETVGERLRRIYPEHYVRILSEANRVNGAEHTARMLGYPGNMYAIALSAMFIWERSAEGSAFWAKLAERERS